MATVAVLWSAGAGTLVSGALGALTGVVLVPVFLSRFPAAQREEHDEVRSGALWFLAQLALFLAVMVMAALVAIAFGIPANDDAVLGDPREMFALVTASVATIQISRQLAIPLTFGYER
jgi:heme/copper-type cytochrome/quinol oxidase subunit 2